MASLPKSNTVTYDEWLRLPEVSDAREEVVNGEIRIMPPNKWPHSQVVYRLNRAILMQTDPAQVIVLDNNFGLVIRKEPLTTRVPDLAMFRTDTIVERDGYIHSAPQLAVEVLSPANNRREREQKLADYAALGVPEVWIVSIEARTFEILLLDSGRLRTSTVLTAGLLKPTAFPGVQVDIAQIWPD